MRAAGVTRIAFSSTGSVYGEPEVVPDARDAPVPGADVALRRLEARGRGADPGLRARVRLHRRSSSASSRSSASATRTATSSTSTARCGSDPDAPARARRRPPGEVVPLRRRLRLGDDARDRPRTLEPGTVDVYNLGTDETIVVDDSIATITAHLGVTPELEYTGGRARLARRQPADPPRLRAHPGARLAADADDSRGDHAHARLARAEPGHPRRAGGAHERHLQPRAAAHQPRRRRHRPALVLPRARRLPRRRGDRQVRLHAHPHGLPAPLPHEVLGVRGGRRALRDPRIRSCARRCCATGAATRSRSRRSPTSRPGPGSGSSGAFTVCLLKALALARRVAITPGALAEDACEIEIDVLGEPIGKQDQYVAAHGGICAYTFNTDGTVDVEPLELVARDARRACATTSCSSTRARRASASAILADQVKRTEARRRGRCSRTSTGRRRSGIESRGAARAGDLEQLRRADARALGEQAQPLAGHGDRADRAPLHARAPQRRHRRQARRRRRRRLPARLRAPARTTRVRRWQRRGAPELRFDFEFQGCYGGEYT